jgi:hypothetical protein
MLKEGLPSSLKATTSVGACPGVTRAARDTVSGRETLLTKRLCHPVRHKRPWPRQNSRFSYESWLAALDDFRNWLIREAA